MPVGIGFGNEGLARGRAPGTGRFTSPPGFHPGAAWLAAAAPLIATLYLLARLAS